MTTESRAGLRVFGPPGEAPDFREIPGQLAAWDAFMQAVMSRQTQLVQEELGGPGRPNAFSARPLAGAATVMIPWNGFPKRIADAFGGEERYQEAERIEEASGRRWREQDEYLEWHTTRDPEGVVHAVDFTCEGPEYWEALAEGYPYRIREAGLDLPPARGSHDVLLRLYRRYVSPEVQLDDLLVDGVYDPSNEWNVSGGAMHLTHPANTLGAEVNLAARASILRQRNGNLLTDSVDLINCAGYGDPGRSSDPNIGATVNAAVREGNAVTLRAPVGLYIDSVNLDGWTTPDGQALDPAWWRIERGTPEMILRARFAPPAGSRWTVSDVEIAGVPIEYAGQIAEHITMKLYASAVPGFRPAPPIGCRGFASFAAPSGADRIPSWPGIPTRA
ncbi:hypothetical protein [Cryptosporangium aurantiacum]|uniref:hypothetical protein n=1 Tax=Cryptosporangium aurantiacum TaxID=134849 RepID=UPI0011613F90|nr:hypothetical protein [Cryptosporangium aurantiacum]